MPTQTKAQAETLALPQEEWQQARNDALSLDTELALHVARRIPTPARLRWEEAEARREQAEADVNRHMTAYLLRLAESNARKNRRLRQELILKGQAAQARRGDVEKLAAELACHMALRLALRQERRKRRCAQVPSHYPAMQKVSQRRLLALARAWAERQDSSPAHVG